MTNVVPRRRIYPGGLVYERGEHYQFLPNHHRRLSPVEYIVDPATGCWLWQRGLYRDGYGAKWDIETHTQVRAHRWYYEQRYGPIPEGLTVDHVHERGCRYRHCVNPEHLEPVTKGENVRRGRHVALKETCRAGGHPWVEENIHVDPRTGKRSCLTCRWERNHKLR